MIDFHNEPVMYVQRQRVLADERYVLSGPTFSRSFVQSQKEIAEVCVASAKETFVASVDFSKPQMLTSSEMLGFDPFSDPLASLRELQRFSSVVLDTREHRLELGSFVFGSSRDLRVTKCMIQITEVTVENLLRTDDEEISEEFLVLRMDGGYVAIPVHSLAIGQTELEVSVAIESRDISFSVQSPLLFYPPKSTAAEILFHCTLKEVSVSHVTN